MSNSVRPHRRQPTRLPSPWDSPGKNPGVGCHFLLQCLKVKSESEVTQSRPTLSDPMDCSLPGSSVHGIFQARVLEWGAFPSPELFHSTLYIGSWVPEDMPGCEATCEPRPKAGQTAKELEENEESDDSLLLQILMVPTQEPEYL